MCILTAYKLILRAAICVYTYCIQTDTKSSYTCVYLLHTNWLSVRLLTLVPLSNGGALQEPAMTVVKDERELRKLGNQRSSQSQRRGFPSKLLWKQAYV